MKQTDRHVQMDAMERLVCCVCDMRNFSHKPKYFCSKNCEKLFLVTQGLVLGNVLQSIFGNVFERKYSDDQRDAKDMASEWSDKFSEQPRAIHEDLEESDESKCYTSVPELQNNYRSHLKAEPRERMDVMDDSFCGVLSSDAESETASTDSEPLETFQTRNTSGTGKPNTCNGVTTRAKYQISKKNISVSSSIQKDLKDRTRNRGQPLKEHTGFKHKKQVSPVTSKIFTRLPSITDCNKGSNKNKTESDQDQRQARNTDITLTGRRRVKCKRCGKMVSKSYLYVHYRSNHKDHLQDVSASSLSCSECGKLFMRKQALNAHKLKLHNHRFSHTCSNCGKGFASRFGLSWHMRQVHKVTVRQCGTCGETFQNRRDYKKHRRYQHSSNSHVCHICGKGFKLKNALQAHLDAHAGVKLHFCELCGDGFVRFSSLCQHKNNLHGPKKSELPFQCHLCPNAFRLQSWLEKHIAHKHQSGGDSANANCKLCQDYSKTSVPCMVHGGGARETFSCSQCNKVFAKETNLKAHMKQHQEPKFSCDICQKKFTYKCNMLRHKDTHNRDKQFQCDICAKQFCSKFLLASHMRMHNQDLLFKCGLCGKGLTRKDYLKNHLKKMHPEAEHSQI